MTHKTPTRPLIVLAATLLAAGCGVKGSPDLPGDKTDMFPRVYPDGAVPPETPPTNVFIERWRGR